MYDQAIQDYFDSLKYRKSDPAPNIDFIIEV